MQVICVKYLYDLITHAKYIFFQNGFINICFFRIINSFPKKPCLGNHITGNRQRSGNFPLSGRLKKNRKPMKGSLIRNMQNMSKRTENIRLQFKLRK